MTVKQINSMLMFAAMTCCAAAGLIVAAGLFLPLDSASDSEQRSTASHSPNSRLATTLPALNANEAFWSRPLRGSLSDAGPNSNGAAPVAAANGNAQSLTLVGTIGETLALIRLPDGSVVARGVGDDVAGAGSVLDIGPKGVEMSVNGQRILLPKPQPATSTGVLLERAS